MSFPWKFANRVEHLKSSSIMEIAAKAQQLKAKGIDVVSLAAGEPDFNTPEAIQAAATRAMQDGITKYTPAPGFPVLREAIAKWALDHNQIHVNPNEVMVTSGAKHAIYLALQCLLDPGDVVLVPTPAWVSYGPMVELTGATLVPLPTYEEDGYRPNVDHWKGLSLPKNAKGIIINSPNNPTGAVYTKDDLIKLVSWAMQRNLWILSDEIYDQILYDGMKFTSTAALGPEAKRCTITINGFSKCYAMTGWRLGWTLAEPELIERMAALQSQSNSHVTSFVQWAGLAACKLPHSVIEQMVTEFDKRRNYCMERLNGMKDHLSYARPAGAFYFFLNLNKVLTRKKITDQEFCRTLLEQYYVGSVPGSTFGKEKTMRISYATSMNQLEKAFDRLERCLEEC